MPQHVFREASRRGVLKILDREEVEFDVVADLTLRFGRCADTLPKVDSILAGFLTV